MKGCRPEYYDRFRCIAGACKDSCCIGWEIDVDEEKQSYYRSIEGELGQKLHTCIDWKEGHFILRGEEERCPFLNEGNLCDLIIGLGEESLCDICREHPRFYDWYEGYTEVGLGLCCEEAARLLLSSEEKCSFLSDDYADEEPWINVLLDARETAYLIIQNRRHSIWERLYSLAVYIEELQQCMDFDSLEEAEETVSYYRENPWIENTYSGSVGDRRQVYDEVLRICCDLEAMDPAWPDTIKTLQKFIEDERRLERAEKKLNENYGGLDYQYEHLAVYFTYRYFMKSREDSNIRSKGMIGVFCIFLIHLLDLWNIDQELAITTENRAWNAKNCSKEIEYSEENLEKLNDLFFDSDMEAICGLF